MDDPPATDDADRLLASLADLGGRIDAARSSPAEPGGRRSGALWALGASIVVVLAVVAGIVGFAADGDDGDVAADRQTTVTTVAAPTSSVTSSTEGPATTAAPTTVAPTTVPTTTPPTAAVPPVASEPSYTEQAPAAPSSDPVAGARGEVTVAAGDSFWTIAEDEAARRVGHEPTVAEVTRVWADILAANTDRLVQPGNPDLILPGQVMVLPGAGAAP